MRRTIGDIAAFVTSKNAGPSLLTLDIVFPDRATYERFKALKALDCVTVAGLYGIMAEDVLKIIEFDPAHAVKITTWSWWTTRSSSSPSRSWRRDHGPAARLTSARRPEEFPAHG